MTYTYLDHTLQNLITEVIRDSENIVKHGKQKTQLISKRIKRVFPRPIPYLVKSDHTNYPYTVIN